MQTLINKFFLFLFISSSALYGCAICTIYSPETKFYVEVDASPKKINTAKVTWVLTREFTDSLKDVYDKNANNFFDKNELELIEQAIYDYVVPRNYLVQLSYSKTLDKESFLPINVNKRNVYIKNSILHFDYTIDLNFEVKDEHVLYFRLSDDENYFVLVHFDKLSKINKIEDVKTTKIATRDELIFNFTLEGALAQKPTYEKNVKQIKQTEKEIAKQNLYEESDKEKNQSILKDFVKKVKYYLVRIENGDNLALLMLLVVSFVYGVIHALGPGHGKSLAFSYFMANKSSYTKAFIISQASAFIHIIGAMILVIVSIFILQSVLNSFVNDSVEILTKFSSVLIMALALFILYRKIKNKGCSCSSCCSTSTKTTKSPWSTSKPKTTNSLKPNFMKQDWYFVITSGLIPCPGTVVLFIYAFVLKTYFAVILASIAISFGMGLVIFASSFLGISVKNLSEKSHKVTYALEIIAPIVMFILGIFLFLNAQIF
ncbi:sodium:proton antiporter [Arcobacter sp. CECT 8983]|uniref:nickel/cobalt transporter n=1 Tax=Arcobacter sp. CECT 8983 TaxID=2044508 RepID=UPI00100C272C|nr:DUF1007 domain-containing protein [Arcobacter sp. CECT 8983]RXJ88753.1 sodium:proton antiporter [Arcobacter sp. CECT 8983]